MHAGESYPASGLSVEITPLLCYAGSPHDHYGKVFTRLLLELFLGGGRGQGYLSPFYIIWSRANGFQPFAWVPWGVYIGLPPRGTMVIRLGAGLAVSASDLRLLRRLLGPADWCAPLTG